MRHGLGLPMSTLVLVLCGCDAKTEASAEKASSKAEASKPAEASGKSDAPAKAAAPAGSKLEFSTSAGPGLSAVPTKCTIGADGKGAVEADAGKFELSFEGNVGKLKWLHEGGELRADTTVTVTGSSLRFSGMQDGVGHDGEVTCK